MRPLRFPARLGATVLLGATALSFASLAAAAPAAQTTGIVTGERVAQFARQQVLVALATRGWRADVEVMQTPRDVPVGAAQPTLSLRDPVTLVDSAGRVARHVSARVDITVADAVRQSIPVSLDVTVLDTGRRVSASGAVPLAVASEGPGQAPPPNELGRAVSTSSPVTQRAAAARTAAASLAIRRGEYRTLRATDGAIQMEGRAQALEDGWTGQTIHVRLASGTDAVLATVTPGGQLELRP